MMKAIENAKELENLLKKDHAILIDFYAETCPPCQAIMPIVDKLAGDYEGRVEFHKVDVHKFPDLRTKYQIGSIPALLFVKNSKILDKSVGVVPESALVDKLESLIKA
ncbi:thioredoxin [Marinifilum flexuosum]|uniref:Thioredoxin n=2 Tax=Marinifilum flexuosum TaxID=1117708 RepID=A0A419X4E9_9BACT|nr:thioredoxin [Marinifilum flexuosum]